MGCIWNDCTTLHLFDSNLFWVTCSSNSPSMHPCCYNMNSWLIWINLWLRRYLKQIGCLVTKISPNNYSKKTFVLLMEEILHQLICSFFPLFTGFIHTRWCRISSINGIICLLPPHRNYMIKMSTSILYPPTLVQQKRPQRRKGWYCFVVEHLNWNQTGRDVVILYR